MKLRYIVIVLAGVVMLAGCSAKTGNPVLKGSESGINDQMRPLKTKGDVKNTFGEPDLIFTKDKVETFEYRRIDGDGRYQWLIPILGWVMSWWQDTFTYEETNLFVRFDGEKVKDWKVLETGGTTN